MTYLHAPTADGQSRSKRDLWRRALISMVAAQAFCRLAPETRPGRSAVFLWTLGQEVIPYTAGFLLVVSLVGALIRRPFWTRRRVTRYLVLAALMGSGALFRTYPSSHDGQPSRVPFRLPLDGPVTVAWGGPRPEVNYHVLTYDQRWAYDLVVTRGGSTHKGDGSLPTDYYAYNQPVLAPAEGAVVVAFDGDPDTPPGQLGNAGTSPSGNHVVLEVAPGEYLWLCHLKPGSVRAKVGDRVVEGQPVGRVGNSGHTSEPHLHVHLQDAPEEIIAEGIPMPFHHYKTADGRYVASGIPTGGVRDGRWAGQVVENVTPDARPADAETPAPEVK